MADSAGLTIRGDRALIKKLTSLRKRDTRTAVNGGLKKGAKVFREALKKNTPKQTGGVSKQNMKLIRKFIRSTNPKAKPRGSEAKVRGVWTGILTNIFLDVGREEDSLKIRDAVRITAAKLAKDVEFGSDFVEASPWFRPTFEQKKDEALAAFRREAFAKIEAAAKRQAGGSK